MYFMSQSICYTVRSKEAHSCTALETRHKTRHLRHGTRHDKIKSNALHVVLQRCYDTANHYLIMSRGYPIIVQYIRENWLWLFRNYCSIKLQAAVISLTVYNHCLLADHVNMDCHQVALLNFGKLSLYFKYFSISLSPDVLN